MIKKLFFRRKFLISLSFFSFICFLFISINSKTVQAETKLTTNIDTIIQEITATDKKGEKVDNGTNLTSSISERPAGTGQIYYVDSRSCNDHNSGKSVSQPWKTINKINQASFGPGDSILFRSGSVWSGQTLSPKGNNLIISSYDTGVLPKLEGRGTIEDVIQLKNQTSIDISNLDISNQVTGFTGKEGDRLKNLHGIHIIGQDSGELANYKLHNLYVHDVTGDVKWIGGSGKDKPGIAYKNGWDRSKNTGGIVFDIQKPRTKQATFFKDVSIKNNVISNNSYGGIIFKQWDGTDGSNEKWASREDANATNDYISAKWVPHRKIIIENNYINQKKSDYACNGIYLTSAQEATIQKNVVKNSGTCGIELYYVDRATVQYNDVSGSKPKAGGGDSNGIDPDKETSNIAIQYNYVHDNGDGILLCGIKFGTSAVRYNVIKDCGKGKNYINQHGSTGVHYIYNNVFYHTKTTNASFVNSSGGMMNNSKDKHYYLNNIFYSNTNNASLQLAEGEATHYEKNLYFNKNVKIPTTDSQALNMNPLFTQQLGGFSAFAELNALKPTKNSPMIKKGNPVTLTNVHIPSTTRDFFGNSISTHPTMGISE